MTGVFLDCLFIVLNCLILFLQISIQYSDIVVSICFVGVAFQLLLPKFNCHTGILKIMGINQA
jgi:hypothetical protein